MANKIKLKIIPTKFSDFVDKLNIVSSIDDTVKIKIDNQHILMYSMLGGGNVILAFKSFQLSTKDYFDNELENKIDLVIPSAKKFVKNLQFLRDMDKLAFDLNYKESSDDEDLLIVRSLQISSGKFKVNWLGGEPGTIRDISKQALAQRLDIKQKKWSFNITNSDFIDIKKLSSINSERIINMDVIKGVVTLSEKSSWELEVDNLSDERTASLILNKRFLSCINDKVDNIEFLIFENFMLINDENSSLMLSFEQDFSDD
jgi:hypothetical protein